MYLPSDQYGARRLLFFPVLILWLFISIISINHLYPFWNRLVFSTATLGLIGWSAIVLTIFFLSELYWRKTLFLFLLFFTIGFVQGPFLEPPSDPFEHLERIHSYCGETSADVPVSNRGLWHYTMAGTLICDGGSNVSPQSKLLRIDICHGLFVGILMSILFVIAKRVHLSDRWAFLSCLAALLFMGTSKFSYFSYYSFAPSSTSLIIYWLWVTLFFFRRDGKGVVLGICSAVLLIPVLWVNHRQEAVFVGFAVIVWLLINCYFYFSKLVPAALSAVKRKGFEKSNGGLMFNVFFFSCLFICLFMLPQLSIFREKLSVFFVRDLWNKNQEIVVAWEGVHFWGKIWEYRVNDTFGWVAIAVALLSVPYLFPGIIRKRFERKVRIFALASLPLIGYCVPLFHFIWLSNVKSTEYYRLCYSSIYWLFFIDFFQGLEGRFYFLLSKIKKRFAGNV